MNRILSNKLQWWGKQRETCYGRRCKKRDCVFEGVELPKVPLHSGGEKRKGKKVNKKGRKKARTNIFPVSLGRRKTLREKKKRTDLGEEGKVTSVFLL